MNEYNGRMNRTELDPGLKQAVQIGTPLELFDPTTNQVYYILSAEQYQAVASTLADEFDPSETYSLIDEVMAEDDANDPFLDSYQ
jgi:hypothetical protein